MLSIFLRCILFSHLFGLSLVLVLYTNSTRRDLHILFNINLFCLQFSMSGFLLCVKNLLFISNFASFFPLKLKIQLQRYQRAREIKHEQVSQPFFAIFSFASLFSDGKDPPFPIPGPPILSLKSRTNGGKKSTFE